ncbi:MAG TPA: methylenetetrahydrofolate--tRNA-(uracil(54)-C(5))-methyltransferase (FADH(2)-oxidizing) TrmFO, partial [Aminivibrio sp.]|nr:methylenetetrahydrofolate--tRNA-(uracil(54)-C(5))-methyltransferase (FADH(2)-oxidizing) TrmFO [Aminivibrio sp.]
FEDSPSWFEGCLPVEVMASRGTDTLRFGPLRPVGLPLPGTGEEAWAVAQLRQDNREGTLYNLVGFQTSLRWGEQERVFRMIPGLAEAEFARFGVMHRNIYVNAPAVLDSRLRFKNGREDLFLAGQITGVEGYMESTAMGCAAALNMAALLLGKSFPEWPRETAVGSLLHYLGDALERRFQPMNVNLGIFPPLEKKIRNKALRCEEVARRAKDSFAPFLGRLAELAGTAE